VSCQPAQFALLGIRGDALAAALAVLGLAACLPGARLESAPWFFALAFVTKPTSIYGVVAAIAVLAGAGRRSDAWCVAWRTAAGVAASVVLIIAVSGGRAIDVFAASAAGGSGLTSTLIAPVSLARILRRVPESTFFIQLAAASLLAGAGRRIALEGTAFLVCLMTTLVIYASPATIENHLIDIVVLAARVPAGGAARARRGLRLLLAMMFVGGVSSGAAAIWKHLAEDATDARSGRRAVLEALAGVKAPILFEQPMLAAARGEPPYLLDQHMFSVRVANDPSVANRLVADVEQRQFGAIVIEAASIDLAFADTLTGDAGRRFRAALERAYRVDRTVGGRWIYRPR
jgi:hypothetical protein